MLSYTSTVWMQHKSPLLLLLDKRSFSPFVRFDLSTGDIFHRLSGHCWRMFCSVTHKKSEA